jgi:hypothetical protein
LLNRQFNPWVALPLNRGLARGVLNPASTSGFGSIITPINLNTAIVSPITPVGSGTPREMQFALRLQF